MACSACAAKRANSTRYEVVMPTGTVVFTSSSKPTALFYAKKYKDAKVQSVAPNGDKTVIQS